MSTWFDEDVTCPSCETTQRARLARGVHVSRAPEVRAQVLERTFHRVTCAACGSRFEARRPLVYTDLERRHWLQVELADQRARWPELEPATRATFERAFTGSPLAEPLTARMKVRLVFGVDQLREKLVLWAAGLDDAVVECLKLEAIRADATLASHRLVVEHAGVGDQLDLQAFRDPTDGSGPVRALQIAGAAVARAHDRRTHLATRFPELFGGTFVALYRLLGPRYRWAEPAE